MGQKLILPYRGYNKVTSAYKSAGYLTLGIGKHYGQDLVASDKAGVKTSIFASGSGKVVKINRVTSISDDKSVTLGNNVVVIYTNCLNHKTGASRDLTARYLHFDSIDSNLKVGQAITKDTKLGISGNTGYYSKGVHLHIEFDTDTVYPTYTQTLTNAPADGLNVGSGPDTSVDPCEYFHIGTQAQYGQSICTTNVDNYWVYANDVNLPRA